MLLPQCYSLGFTEYANFFTKFENRTAKMMTGNPTNCTGNSKIGAVSCATTALSVWSMVTSMMNVSNVNDGNIIEIFMALRCWMINYYRNGIYNLMKMLLTHANTERPNTELTHTRTHAQWEAQLICMEIYLLFYNLCSALAPESLCWIL